MTNEVGRPAKNSFDIEVSTVHDALAESRFKRARVPGENTTIRLDPNEKMLAMKICETNGSTISDYLRCCVKALVRDYAGRQAVEDDIGEVV